MKATKPSSLYVVLEMKLTRMLLQPLLLALGDFNLDPAQVLDEVRALELLATDLTLAAPPACSTDRATTY